MSAIAVAPSLAAEIAPLPPRLRLGRAFVHPLFDFLVIGGGLSLVLAALLLGDARAPIDRSLAPWMALLVLLANSAHFAASTVRLYTKPRAFQELRVLTMAFPLVVLGVLWLALEYGEVIGARLIVLYLTWSPFHYAAQAYGLSLMYAYRSGCSLSQGEKRLLRLSCLSPFLALLVAGRGIGLDWLLTDGAEGALAVFGLRLQAARLLTWLTFVVPIAIFTRRAWERRATLPIISLAIVASNAVWLVTLNRLGAFAYATVFHGLQYLAIVTVFHVRDRMRSPGNSRGWIYHAAGFYLACLALGYVLFQIWPFTYALLGFGLAQSALLVTAMINLHHFIVDAYIWKLRQAPNYSIAVD